MAVLKGMLPRQDVAISVVRFVAGPRSHFDLKRRVVAVHAEKVINGRLGVRFHLHSAPDVDVIHQVKRPQVIVDVFELPIRAAEVRNLVVELTVHL